MTFPATPYLLLASLAAAPPPADPAAPARAVLARHCLKCHDGPGRAKGGLAHVTDVRTHVERGLVVPGKPLASPLFRRMHDGEMPPPGKAGPLPPADRRVIRDWIAAGAPLPAGASSPFTEADALRIVRADLRALPARRRRFARYLTLGCLAGRDAELPAARHALAKLANSLSWHARLTAPHAVDPRRLVYRLDLRDYRWSARSWDRLAAGNPYRPAEPGPLRRAVAELAGCDQPLLRGDWFVAAASRPPSYHDFLQLPTSDRALERQLQVDMPANLADDNAVRTAFNGSGVARRNRLLERHDAAHGAYWRSHDFADNTDRGNLFEYPLGPGPGGFVPSGGEIIFHLPNGLQAYLLVDADGRRIDRAPGEIVSDPTRPDKVVENGLSCIGCHAAGILFKEDQVRAHVRKNPRAFTAAQRETILALYAPADQLRRLVREDNERFAAALKRLGVPAGDNEPVRAVVLRYEEVLDLRRASAEAGVTPDVLAAALARSPALARTLGPLAARGTVQRQLFEDAFPRLLAALPAPQDGGAAPAARPAFATAGGRVVALAWAPSGKQFAAADQDGALLLFDASTGQTRKIASGLDEPRALAFSPDGRRLLSGGGDRVLRLWDAGSGKQVARLAGHTAAVRAVAFTPDGKRAVSAGEDRTVRVWDLAARRLTLSLTGHRGTVTALAVSPDGRFVLSGGADRSVRLWRLADGKWLATRETAGEVLALAFSPDGKRVFCGAGGDLLTGEAGGEGPLRRLGLHGGAVTGLAVRGGEVLAVARGEGGRPILRRWDVGSGRSWPVAPGEGQAEAVAVSPGGAALVAGGGVIRVVSVWR